MSHASITITDEEATGQVTVAADFGEKINDASQAHQMVYVLLQSVLGNAKTVQTIEDTAGDLAGQSAEPSRIIIPE